jgi:O-antigen/teichoic acid export membrane protein
LIKKLVKFSASYAAIEGLQKGILFLLTPVFTHYMSPDEYGVVATVLMIVPFFIIIFSLTLQASISRFYYKYKSNKTKLKDFLGTSFLSLPIITIVFGLLTFYFLEPFFHYSFPDIQFKPYIVYAIIIGSTQPLTISYFSLLKAMQNIKNYAIIFNIYFFVQLILMFITIVYFHMKQDGYLLALVITNFLFIFVIFALLYKDMNICFKIEYIKESLHYSLPLVASESISLIYTMADRYFIMKFVGLAGVGIYFIGYQFALIISLINRAVNSAYLPFFFEKYENQAKDYNDIYRIGDYFVYMSAILALILSIISPILIELLFDKSYYAAKDVIFYLSFSSAFTSIYFLNTNVLALNAGLVKLKTIGIFVGTVVSLVLGYILTKKYGIVGASISTLLGFVLSTLMMIYIVHIKTEFSFNNKKFLVFFIIVFSATYIDLYLLDSIAVKLFFILIFLLGLLYIFEKKYLCKKSLY